MRRNRIFHIVIPALRKRKVMVSLIGICVFVFLYGLSQMVEQPRSPARSSQKVITRVNEKLSTESAQLTDLSKKAKPTQKIVIPTSKATAMPETKEIGGTNVSNGNTNSNTQSQSNQNSSSDQQNGPTPTKVINHATITPTSEPSKSPTTIPTETATPTPIQTGAPTADMSISLSSQGVFTLGAHGTAHFHTIKNLNGYWDHNVNASFTNLMPNRNYQFWLCGVNCSSMNSAKFTSDGSGNGSISTTINHAQRNDPVSRAVVWEIPASGPIPNDPTACFMTSINATPCIRGQIAF